MATNLVRCSECLFWEAYPDRQSGLCRRHAPLTDQHGGEIIPGAAGVTWPVTTASDWCGDSVPLSAARANPR